MPLICNIIAIKEGKMYSLEAIIIVVTILMMFCVVATKYSTRFGVPILILFIGVGIMLGSEGIYGVYFDNPSLTRHIGNIALCFIIFSGGLDLRWKVAKQFLGRGILLSTVGVFLTAAFVGIFAYLFIDMKLLEGFLLGAVVSSTDAASVFAILRARKMKTKGILSPLLEFESASNDPMAYMLTITVIGLINNPQEGVYSYIISFFIQFVIGIALGVLIGFASVQLFNRIHHSVESMYLVLGITMMLFAYSVSTITGGNGFLTVYIAGMIIGNSSFIRKTQIIRFFDGQSWIAQIILFVTLGLQVFPSRFMALSGKAIIISIALIFIIRPLATIPILSMFKTPFKQQLFISFVGFRGAASIVFATYPLTAGIPVAQDIFDMVFFIALTSLMIQGTLLRPVAKVLGVLEEKSDNFEMQNIHNYVDEISDLPLLGVYVSKDSPAIGKNIAELELPDEIRIVAIRQTEDYISPKGNTIIREGDRMLITSISEDSVKSVCDKFKFETS